VAPDGHEATAWVSAPHGGVDGRLYVSTGHELAEIRDSLGPIEPHGEAPPKIAYAPDGSLAALYVVARVAPGERFPLGALRFVRSADGGKTWSAPVTVTDDSTFGSHNFHAMHIASDGTIYVAWLDARSGKSTPYLTSSVDHGQTWAPNRPIAHNVACPCCRTAIATAPNGRVYAAWRRVFSGNVRDIVVATSADYGKTWQEPTRVHADNWIVDACPHAGPALAVDRSNHLHVVWWTGKEGAAGVYYARSDDEGRTFTHHTALGVAQFSRPSHVQLALGDSNLVAVAWDDGTRKVPRITLRLSHDGGATFAPPEIVSHAERVATFPTLGFSGHQVTIAWAEQSVDQAERAERARPNMKDPHAVMGLSSVGESRVLVRSGEIE
jgi:hypothetical protein